MQDNKPANLDLLKELTDEEKEAVRQILKDVSKNGKSENLTDLYYEDYEEIPVDLETFLCDERYLGKYTNYGKDVYDTWKKELAYVHNPINFIDQWAITGCLDGSVKIPLLSGENIPIEDLYKRHLFNPRNNGKDTIDYVYSYDFVENKFVVGELVRVFYTGIKRVYRITLDNGQTVTCTANHPFLTKSKHWKTLNTGLNIGDSLMSFRREYNDGYEVIVSEKNANIQKQYTHRMVAEYKTGISESDKAYEGHHKDFNSLNNYPNNICVITESQHKSYHTKKRWNEDDNFKQNALKALRSLNVDSSKQSERSLKRWEKYKTPDERKKHLQEIGCIGFSSNFNSTQHPNLLKINKDEFINYAKKCFSKWQVIEHFNMSRGGFDSYCKRMNINPKDILKPLNYTLPQNRYNRNTDAILNKLNGLYIEKHMINMQIAENNLNLTDWERNLIKNWEKSGQLEDIVRYYNHKIVKIEYVGEKPTYDLTVRNHHNFCLDCGLVSKNSTGTGKAQPLDALVFTPNGYKQMGDLKVGDKVVCGNGKITKITHIYKRGKLPLYQVTFSDRTSTKCAGDHLWKAGTYSRSKKDIVWNTIDTVSLIKNGLQTGGKEPRWKYRIPLTIIDCWNNDNLPIDPYILGVLIGDGSLSGDVTNTVSVSIYEQDIYDKVNLLLQTEGYKLNKAGTDERKQYRIVQENFNASNQNLENHSYKDKIMQLGLNEKSINKHIPKEYLYTTVENRIRLLQGLFDTDGWVDNSKSRGILVFNTSSKQLSDDFAFLVRSLGGTDTVVQKEAGYKKDGIYKQCNDTFEHTIKLPENILPFSSEKHTNKYIKPQNGPIRTIRNIEYIGEEECQCIVVEDEEHTYLTNDLIVTHNSTVATYSLCYELYKLMCLKNPNRFYLGANETIWILFFNLNLKLAEKTMWGKFQKALQMSPWFLERGTVTGRTNLVYQPNKDIKLGIGSTEEHALSVAVMFVAIDEMSFGDNDNVEYMQAGMMQIYNQLYLRLSSRFSNAGRIQGRMYLISSAKSTNAVLESFIRDNEGQPGMHVSRYKQWEVLPASKFSGKWFKLAVGNELLTSYIMGTNVTEEEIKEAELKGYEVIDVPLETMHRFEMDLNRTLIDTCGIAVQSSYKFIPYRVVEPCISNGINPFKQEIIKTGLGDKYQIKDFFTPELVPESLYMKKIYVHCDLSKNGDMTGISAVSVLGYKNQERYDDTGNQNLLKEMVFRHIFSIGLKCPANDELSMIKVKDFIHYLKYELGWNIAGVSCDGYQSLMLLQSLKLDGFEAKEVSMDILKNKEDVGYTTFKNVLIEKRIKILKLQELIREITNLEKNETTGKVDHPKQTIKVDKETGEQIKSVGKDIADSLGGAIYNATLSVNLDELDYLDGVTIVDNTMTLNNAQNSADQLFGMNMNPDGTISITHTTNTISDDEITAEINKEVSKSRNMLTRIRKDNPNTKLTDQQLLDMYSIMSVDDGMIII